MMRLDWPAASRPLRSLSLPTACRDEFVLRRLGMRFAAFKPVGFITSIVWAVFDRIALWLHHALSGGRPVLLFVRRKSLALSGEDCQEEEQRPPHVSALQRSSRFCCSK